MHADIAINPNREKLSEIMRNYIIKIGLENFCGNEIPENEQLWMNFILYRFQISNANFSVHN